MKHKLLIIALMALSAAGCNKHHIGTLNLPDGNYTGTFRYEVFGSSQKVSHITLQLHNGEYSGTTDIAHYPAICSAAYTRDTSCITFLNICHWPAVADLIPMSGSYNVSIKADSFVLASPYSFNGRKLITLSFQN